MHSCDVLAQIISDCIFVPTKHIAFRKSAIKKPTLVSNPQFVYPSIEEEWKFSYPPPWYYGCGFNHYHNNTLPVVLATEQFRANWQRGVRVFLPFHIYNRYVALLNNLNVSPY